MIALETIAFAYRIQDLGFRIQILAGGDLGRQNAMEGRTRRYVHGSNE
jgi:hypothetical protein